MSTRPHSLVEYLEWRDSFPKPRTIPCGWDVSELMPILWPFAPTKAVDVNASFYVLWSERLRAVLARVGDFVSSLSHSIASR